MNRNQRITLILMVLAALTLATAAYAPYSSTLTHIAKENATYAPCSTTTLPEPSQAAKYPVPPEDVIAQGHSLKVER